MGEPVPVHSERPHPDVDLFRNQRLEQTVERSVPIHRVLDLISIAVHSREET